MQNTVNAIPLILNSEKGFYITQEAKEFLKSIHKKVGIITIVGKYRTGKSLFINKVLINDSKGFKVGPTVNPCTKGLWIWKQPLRSQNPQFPDCQVLVIDSQGFGGTDQNVNHDNRIFLFALLLSSFFIYNSVGSIDQTSLNSLNLIVNMAKQIQIKSNQNEEVDAYFPSFLWVVRDFTLQMVDKDGYTIGSKQYLQKALQIQKGVSDAIENKNKIRRMIKHFFKDRDCATLIRPMESQQHLQNLNTIQESELRPQFIDQIKLLRKRIFKKIKPKQIQQRCLTGEMLLQLATAYIQTINKGNLPNIESAWTYVRKRQSEKACEQSLDLLEQKLKKLKEKIPQIELKNLKTQLTENLLTTFKMKSIGNQQELKAYYKILKQQFKNKFKELKKRNIQKWKIYYQTTFNQISSEFKTNIENQKIKTPNQFNYKFQQLKQEFNRKAEDGLQKQEFLKQMELYFYKEYLIKIITNNQTKKNKQLQYTQLKCQRIEQERKQQKKESKQMQQKIWQIEKFIASKTEEFKNRLNEKQITVEKLQNDKNKTQMELLNYKSKYQKSNNQNEYVKRINQQNKQKIQQMNKRIKQLQINLKRITQENKNNFREKQSALQSLAQKEEDVIKYKRQYNRLKQNLQKQLNKSNKLNQNYSTLKQEHDTLTIEYNELSQYFNQKQNQLKQTLQQKKQKQNQIQTLLNKFQQNKRAHEIMYQSLQQNLQRQNENKQQLLETNKNLSSAVARMELRTKQAEQKIESLKQFKKAIKNASCLQCQHCNKFIACAIFTQHLNICTNGLNPSQMPKQKIIVQIEKLQINIIQTMVKQTDNKPYTQYLITVAKGNAKWTLNRRYKSFCQLHNTLKVALPGIELSDVSYIVNPQQGSKKSLLIQQRRKLLQKYLRDISQNQFVVKQKSWLMFMEIPKQNDRTIVSVDKTLLPQSPEEFLKSWNQRNLRLKQSNFKKGINQNNGSMRY